MAFSQSSSHLNNGYLLHAVLKKMSNEFSLSVIKAFESNSN
jgi:hypothetical protein